MMDELELARKYGAKVVDAGPMPEAPADDGGLAAALKLGAKPVDTATDVGKAAVYAVPKALAGLAGFMHDAVSLSDAGRAKLAAMLPEGPAWLKWVNDSLGAVSPVYAVGRAGPGAADVRRAAERVTGPWYDPQTTAGKVADTAVQTGAMMGRNWLTNPGQAAALTAAITGGTEAAGAATEGSALEPWARLAGGLVGGAVPTVANAMRSRLGNMVRAAVGDVTPEQERIAVALQDSARKDAGVPLLATEALDRAPVLASKVANSLGGNAIMGDFLKQRPSQVATAVRRSLIEPTGNSGKPADNAALAQRTATEAVESMDRARTASSQRFFAAAHGDQLPADALREWQREAQRLILGEPVGSPNAEQIGRWYSQAFPQTIERVAFPTAAAPAAAPRAPWRPTPVDETADDLVTAIRKLGGINVGDEAVGSLAKANPFPPHPQFGPVWRSAPVYGGASNRTNTVAGHGLDEMAQKLAERGYPVSGPDDVMDAIANAGMGTPTFSSARDIGAAMRGEDPLVALNDTLMRLNRNMAARNQPAPPRARDGMGQPFDPRNVDLPGAAIPERNAGALYGLKRQLDIAAHVDPVGATPEAKYAAEPAQRLAPILTRTLRENSPNIQAGTAAHRNFTTTYHEPFNEGPVGRMARPAGLEPGDPGNVSHAVAQISDPAKVHPSDIRQLWFSLNSQNPEAFPGLAKTWLENELGAAIKSPAGGPSHVAGAKFWGAVYGGEPDVVRRGNFEEVMRGVADARGVNPDELVEGARRLMLVLERSGRTPGAGSPTATRSELNAIGSGSLASDVMQAVSTKPMTGFAQKVSEWANVGRDRQLADILTRPDGVQQLIRLARVRPNSLTARYYVASLLGLPAANGANE